MLQSSTKPLTLPVSTTTAATPAPTRATILGEFDLEARARLFLRRYPGLRGQYNLDLVQCTPYLLPDERAAVEADCAAVFRALRWACYAGTSRLDKLVPDSRTPFKHCITFCWYAYTPYSAPGSRMRALYRNVLFKDAASWRVSNKQTMLRRLELAEASSRLAVEAGLAAAGGAATSVSSCSFIPASQVYSLGRETAVVADVGLGLQTSSAKEGDDGAGGATPRCIVKPAAGLKGRGIRLYRVVSALTTTAPCSGESAPNAVSSQQSAAEEAAQRFARFMQDEYGEAAVRSNFYVIQRYIDPPLLIRDRKFDLRVYLLIVPNMACGLSCDSNPGRRGFYAFYHPGFARLSCLPYAGGGSNDLRVHLTNSCLQQAAQGGGPDEESNWTPDRVNDYFNERFDQGLDGMPCRDWFRVTAQADLQAILAYLSVRLSRSGLASRTHNSYRLLGCDFLVDAERRVWLLELNSLPSLRMRNACHRAVKSPMQREALALAIEVAHRSANGLPVTNHCLAMRQNFRLVYSPAGTRPQARLLRNFAQRLRDRGSGV